MALYYSGKACGRMPLYELEGPGWIAEADLTGEKLTGSEPARTRARLQFVEAEVPIKQPQTKQRENAVWERLITEAKQKDRQLFDGPLVSYRGVWRRTPEGPFEVWLAKSGYKEHHGACPLGGKRDEWTEQFFPYQCLVGDGWVRPLIRHQDMLYPSFALSTVVQADKQLVVLDRGDAVDQYSSVPSLPSGGRMSGDPHKAAEDLWKDPAAVYTHAAGMLTKEVPGLDQKRVTDIWLTGIQRSLADFDAQLSLWIYVDLPASSIEGMMLNGGMLGGGKKYAHMRTFPAGADGMVQLLREPFPGTVQPVTVYAAHVYGVDPQDVLPELKVIGR